MIGYDPYNEPFSTETQTASESTFTGQLECFYIGKAHPAYLANGAGALTCPPGDPDNGVIPTIQSVDSHHLTFVEPDIYWVTGGNIPSQLGPLPFTRIVFNFHAYCGDRSPVTGNPTDLLKCLQSEETAASEQDVTRLSMGSAAQPTGPAIFMSEFGATTSVPLAGFDVEWAGLGRPRLDLLGLEVLRRSHGLVGRGAGAARRVLFAHRDGAVAHLSAGGGGRPQLGDLQSLHGGVQHGLRTDSRLRTGSRPCSIAASQHYPNGWCAAVKGGRITSKPGASHLTVQTVGHPTQVYISVTPGACPSSS